MNFAMSASQKVLNGVTCSCGAGWCLCQPARRGDTNGAVLHYVYNFAGTGIVGALEDVGSRGEMPVILDSFRFGKAP